MKKIEVRQGDFYGKLKIIREIDAVIISNKPRRRFECECECRNIITTQLVLLTSGKTQSCGCYQKQRAKEGQLKHGLEKHPLYSVWKNMKKRCYNINYTQYQNYGGRGITICDSWKDNFQNFYNWSISTWQQGLTIDRINNSEGYTPNNCRWVSMKIQCNNSRKNHNIVYNGSTYTLSTLAEHLNIPYNIVRYRISNCKWTVKKLIKQHDKKKNTNSSKSR